MTIVCKAKGRAVAKYAPRVNSRRLSAAAELIWDLILGWTWNRDQLLFNRDQLSSQDQFEASALCLDFCPGLLNISIITNETTKKHVEKSTSDDYVEVSQPSSVTKQRNQQNLTSSGDCLPVVFFANLIAAYCLYRNKFSMQSFVESVLGSPDSKALTAYFQPVACSDHV